MLVGAESPAMSNSSSLPWLGDAANLNESFWADAAGTFYSPPIIQVTSVLILVSFGIGSICHTLAIGYLCQSFPILQRFRHLLVCILLLSLLDLMQLLWGLAWAITTVGHGWIFGLAACYAVFIFETLSKILPYGILLIICLELWGLLAGAFRRSLPETRTLLPIFLLILLNLVFEWDIFYSHLKLERYRFGLVCALSAQAYEARKVHSMITFCLFYLGPLVLIVIIDRLRLLPRHLCREDPVTRAVLSMMLCRWLCWMPLRIYEFCTESGAFADVALHVHIYAIVDTIIFVPTLIDPILFRRFIRRLILRETLDSAGYEYVELTTSARSSLVSVRETS